MPRLDRFREAQNSPHSGFDSALHEIRAGGKRGHWIWYLFPQISGLGTSEMSQTFAISGEDEAVAFLRDSELRSRLITITEAVAEHLRGGATSLRTLMGSDIDARKVVSSLTLFRQVARGLGEAEDGDAYNAMAAVAAEVLDIAASQGFPPCAYTLRRLRRT
jgi:uncharacterized protein (DUF1810 family)